MQEAYDPAAGRFLPTVTGQRMWAVKRAARILPDGQGAVHLVAAALKMVVFIGTEEYGVGDLAPARVRQWSLRLICSLSPFGRPLSEIFAETTILAHFIETGEALMPLVEPMSLCVVGDLESSPITSPDPAA